ncbi:MULTISPECIES: SPOR domain-containing protein [unclassified Photobacterium]|uniref:SPOR domain-containing protein n=1 Tax=unclassified Photobacterium TaxID=2628852 RepID=UPI000D1662C1|nr:MULTISPECIES: SPOR domain-containing protein [unclassified Photobacterium]PSV27129.1 SPOR domain-containing protein [Photobacterium sp. GB-56]PSV29689.1 SPOR domain-containing protein [Photobacterium sp. GB-72]PSV34968.1 SPOR domain-containing protein [Photobacterium sp. GB-27]PSV35502.1 SPOR domain-containing protein [Photobacterium sp. GB-210]PSV43063.1 SPOR domain-containing protein [Photobacterium sp. GB-36]
MTLLTRKAVTLLGLLALSGCASSDSPCDSGYLMPSKIDGANFQCEKPTHTVVPETTVTPPPVIDSDYINNNNAHLEDETSMTNDQAFGDISPSRYTVQILALSEERNLRGYLQPITGNEPIWVNWKHVDGRNWYAVIYGNFATKDEARQAIHSLPASVQAQGPFPLSFAKVKADKEGQVYQLR